MNVVLLSGGCGKRLWPLSNAVRSKQFIRLFEGERGKKESMIERTYRSLRRMLEHDRIVIAAGKDQIGAIRNHLGNEADICVEPCRRDTFPAIALASAYLKYEKHAADDECVIVCPVDQCVNDCFFHAFRELEALVEAGEANLVLMGIEPTGPSEKYGYIVPESDAHVSAVRCFREKPDKETARKLIGSGALWNAGVFAFRLSYLLELVKSYTEFSDYAELCAKYEKLKKTSFDYAVVEAEKKIQVLRYRGQWRDVGTWNSLCEALEGTAYGNVLVDESSEKVHVVNEMDIPVVVMGGRNLIVAASADGILVADKGQSDRLKEMVERLNSPVRFTEHSWGCSCTLDAQDASRVEKLELKPGAEIVCHRHKCRSEVWTVLSGEGRIYVGGEWLEAVPGVSVQIRKECAHMLLAYTEMTVLEVQSGTISPEDEEICTDMTCKHREAIKWQESGL